MIGFVSKFFKNDSSQDNELLSLQAALGVEQITQDRVLILASIENQALAKIESYLAKSLTVDHSKEYDLREEIMLFQLYMDTYKSVLEESVNITSTIHIENADITVFPFILFPLIQNALTHGYNSMKKYPIRVKLQVLGNKIRLEVSNRVNHYISSQEDTSIINLFKARLNLLYPDTHTLIINSNSNIFKSTLILG